MYSSSLSDSKNEELLNLKYHCKFFVDSIISEKGQSLLFHDSKIFGIPPSQKVKIKIKFSFISSPNNSNILFKIYF